jgi:hypothetical protein
MVLLPTLVVFAVVLLLAGWLVVGWLDEHFRPRGPLQNSDDMREFPHGKD